MEIHLPALTPLGRVLRLLGIASLGALLVLGSAHAQETPEATDEGQETPVVADGGTRVFLEVEAPTGEPVDEGDTFFVHVMIEDVEDLSGFGFQISYDRERVEPIKIGDGDGGTPAADGTPGDDGDLGAAGGDENVEGALGEFLADSPRGSLCSGPFVRPGSPGRVFALCAGVALPVCLDGPEGIDGSGRLGTVAFKSKRGDMTDIVLADTDVVSDDVEPPCDPQGNLTPISIPHTTGGSVTVLLSGGGGTSILVIAIIVIVVVAVLGAGLAGFLLYQRRGSVSA